METNELRNLIRQDKESCAELNNVFNEMKKVDIGTKALNFANMAVEKVELEFMLEKAVEIHGGVVIENKRLNKENNTLKKELEVHDPNFKIPTKVKLNNASKEKIEKLNAGIQSLMNNWK